MTDPDSPHQIPIAVVGVSAIFPGSVGHTGFWRDILAAKDLLTDVPPTHWLIEDFYDPDPTRPDKTYVRRGGFIPDVDFDPMHWGVPPSTVPQTDTTQLLALIVARQVLDDACQGSFQTTDRNRVSCILGVTSGQELMGSMVSRLQRPVWVKALREEGVPEREVGKICDRISSNYTKWEEANFPGLLGNVVAGRIANRLDLGGTNCVTDAACASTFSALSMAVNELSLGQSDLVIAGGCDAMNDIFMYVCFSKTPALSPTGDCRPFSDAADGTMLGEGLGMVALKRLSDAERDGDRVYAVIKAVGASSDGRAKSVYAPLPEGQAKALRRAYDMAGYGPDSVELVEAHGTGTKAGDAAEFEGLRTVFNESGRSDRQWCALGSVKSQIGHTKSAAGAAGLIKAVLALHHKVLPPTIKIARPNPKLSVEASPFYLSTVARPWIRDSAHPRRAGVSSFGFGGSNFHVAVEEYTGPAPHAWRLRTLDTELVVLQGADDASVAREARALAHEADRCMSENRPGFLVYLARTTQAGYDASAAVRLSVVAHGDGDLAAKLRAAADALDGAPLPPRGIFMGRGPQDGSLGFLFPGQGSQYPGMGAEVAMHLDAARSAWDDAATIAHRAGHPAPHEVTFPRPGFDDAAKDEARKNLTRTENAQPALGAASLALLRVMDALGVKPAAVTGHSFGEVMALQAAGVLSASDALRVATLRGVAMADAARSTPGAMVAVSASLERVQSELSRVGGTVTVANHNAPDQVVLSGSCEAVDALEHVLRGASLTFKRLDVGTAFHSPIVGSACEPFHQALASIDVGVPTMPVYGNTTAAPYAHTPEVIRRSLADQLAQPVRFVETIEAMYAAGVRTFVEVGAGATLSGLVSATLGARPHAAIPLDRRGSEGMNTLHHALARLVACGLPMSLEALWSAYAPAHDPRTDAKPRVALRINGSNYAKPYPPPGGAAALPRPNPERPVEAPPPMTQPSASVPTNAAPATTAPASGTQLAWVQAFQETQRQTAEAHAAFQRAMADSHAAFLRTAEMSFSTLGAMLGAAPMAATQMVAPAYVPPPVVMPTPAVVAAPVMPTPVAKPAPVVPAPIAAPTVDVTAAMLAVVSQKTGYPQEMLGMAMELEADLGIDSIKRVEILSALREKVPGLPELDPTELGSLRTLGQIVARIEAGAPTTKYVVAVKAQTVAAPQVDLLATMLEVVAQKTGYPREMIGMDMELEADLGIDSIKRVEILSAVRERAPGIPDLDPTVLGSLRTVGQIVARMTEALPGHTPAPVAPSPVVDHVPAVAPRAATGRYILRAVAREAAGMVSPGLLDAKRLVVTEDGRGIAPALVAILHTRGVAAEAVREVPQGADAVIFLGGLRDVTGVNDISAIHKEAFVAAKAIAAKPRALVIVQDTGGDFGLSGAGARAALGGLSGLAKTAAREWPDALCRTIDLQAGDRSAASLAAALADELLAGGPEIEVGLRADGTRLALESLPATITDGAPVLARGDVVVASGGARGVTAATLVALTKATGCRLALLGRTPIEDEATATRGILGDAALKAALMDDARKRGAAITPAELSRATERVVAGREVRATLEAIRNAGGEARYIALDVTDGAAVRTAVDEVRKTWGPIAGIVHGAGVLADKRIADKTVAQFEHVWNTKVRGLSALLDATASDPLKVLCVFSSVAGRCGNPGQSDYAMANEALNKMAVAESVRRGASVVVKSLGWGPWEGGMVTPSLKTHFERMGIPLIPLDVGAAMLVRELSSNRGPEVEIVLGGDPRDGSLDGQSPSAVQRLELRIDAAHFPAIASHEVRGVPVVPAVLAIELFTRAARARRPDLVVRVVRSLQVLKGIRLPRFGEGFAERFVIESRPVSANGVHLFSMVLLGVEGTRHYSAQVEMGAALTKAPHTIASAGVLQPWNGEIYDGDALFHGPMFRAIQSVEGTGAGGITGTLVGRRELGWPEGAWDTDPALLDGALQLAVLWTRCNLSGASLPTSLGSWTSFGDVRGAVHATAVGKTYGRDRAVFDVTLADDHGAPVGELKELELHILPAR